VSKVKRSARHIIGQFGDDPPGNHLHWYGPLLLTDLTLNSLVYLDDIND